LDRSFGIHVAYARLRIVLKLLRPGAWIEDPLNGARHDRSCDAAPAPHARAASRSEGRIG
jgi:hypothetical protein